MNHVKHALEAAIVALLAQAPAILASPAARAFVEKHPALAVYIPLAVGLASAAYQALKPKPAKKKK